MRKKSRSKTLSRAPFGSPIKRFTGMGFHPNLDVTGCMLQNKSPLGPGQYNPERYDCAYKKYNIGGSSWKRKKDLEEFSKNLGYRNGHILRARIFNKSIGGPGFYDIPEEIFQRQTASAMRNIGFGGQPRFWSALKDSNPPLGTYNVTKRVQKQSSSLPTMEWDGFVDRFKDTTPSYHKPPNIYDPKDYGSIAALLTKKVSKRGPYDCFTGPRDGSTIKNHFAPPTFKGPVNWFNTWPNELQILLNHPSKRRYGLFLKDARFGRPSLKNMLEDLALCYRDPDEPSPCTYSIENNDKEVKQNMYPFNTSNKDARPPTKWIIHPGVGRYTPKILTKCAKVKRESWVFKSKTERNAVKVVEYNAF